MEPLAGKTINWMFDDGPMAGVKIQHAFDADGGVTWRILDGPHQGVSVREQRYGAAKVNENTWVLSYLAKSGHTLTVVLSLDDGRAVAFGSNETSWAQQQGRFEIVH
jgi:hypothetical protein